MRGRTKHWTGWMTLLITVTVIATGCGLFDALQSRQPTPAEEPSPVASASPEMTASPTTGFTATASPPTEATATPVPPTPTSAATELDPAVAIHPTSGAPGTAIEVNATGFQPGATAEVGMGRANSEYDVVSTAVTDSEGQIATTVTLPDYAEDGERWVVVVSVVGQPVKGTSNLFTVTRAAGAPTVVVAPRAGSPGTSVTVRAEGFAPEATVDVGFGRIDSGYDVLQSAQADAAGTVTAEVLVPDFAAPEDTWVFVVANTQTGATAVSGPFDVTSGMASPTKTPTAGGFTSANIHLIAVDDGGANGKLIGCNDSVVPVQVTFDPTIAPLRAALNQLLSLDTEYHGGSGLYNALYQSNLSAGAINIVQGTATIALTREITLGGACDAPRVEAQIKETALQFSTVQNVQVTLNGQPLEEVLSAQ
ncbi:MAG: GerMN domain-containing protein [Anaerolineae bacterium]|nr:GerMN domain-containing protein [Anaerolineae bacterium]